MNASLPVRPEQRLNPRRYKPLAVEAMRGIVPARTLTRTTKSETSTTIALGLERHRDQILGLAEGSLLAERGLIDPAQLRDLCSGGFSWPVVRTLDSTIACEMWLRTLTTTVAST
jgi:asparagine synthase (glutamine-hydrolysing)